MIDIKELEKLRQGVRQQFKDASDNELERIRQESDIEERYRGKLKEIAEFEEEAKRRNATREAFLESLKEMEKLGELPEGVVTEYTTAGGVFAPHLKHKAIDAERLANKAAAEKFMNSGDAKPKRTRRKKSET